MLARQEDLVLPVEDSVFGSRQVAQRTARDPALSRVMNLVQKGGWPEEADAALKPFADKRLELSVCAGVLLWVWFLFAILVLASVCK